MKLHEIFELEKLSILKKGYGCIICEKPDKHLGFLGYCAKHSSGGTAYLGEDLIQRIEKTQDTTTNPLKSKSIH